MNFYYKLGVLKMSEEKDKIARLVCHRMFKSQLYNMTKKKKSNFWMCRVASPEEMDK